MPAPEERRRHWNVAFGATQVDDDLVGLRVPRGTLHRVARAVPPGSADPMSAVMAEIEHRGRFAFDGVAHRMAPISPGEFLLCVDDAREEFAALLARCRYREALGAALPAAFGHGSAAGVRALFKGPSGTGKTLAARHLAAEIRRPLYRVDLAATVSKYIGETERNLERVFEAAESLDIVLLIDEGDALMAGRTGVSSATDRYANLETNYLLQRLESYAGILLVTTNAPERIDGAFARRMDVTLEFPLPDADTRFDLWLAHLASGHAITAERLDEVALRCVLSGGQIRNAALHATLLALRQATTLGDGELLTALQREYRKAGQSCPSLSEG
jgi:SpoVK/Ycf46/Vps4 family AAA+-type ATPase